MGLPELEKKFGAKAVSGILAQTGGKFYLTIGRKKTELDKSKIISAEPIDKSVDEKGVAVSAFVAPDNSVLSILLKKHHILCYLVGPDFGHLIDMRVRQTILDTMIQEGKIPVALGAQLRQDLKL